MSNTTNQQENSYQNEKIGVHIRNIYLTYSNSGDNILNGVDLNIKKGEIYALLGPSGCGKTTLLRCILGIKKPNYGDVKIFNNIPGDRTLQIPGPNVGYMPQEIALYTDLTIYEMLFYFGKIFNLKQNYINQRVHELSGLLNLPDHNRTIKTLSLGQQRRVSFAATVMHFPKLIILDEPTAGVDPLLREKIWLTLIKMKKDHSITFIITTHYIEEARRAEKVGFLRKGKILREGSPDYLLKLYNCNTLEDVFLKICLNKRKSTITTPDELNSFKEAFKQDKDSNLFKQRQYRKRSIFACDTSPHLPQVAFSENMCSINEVKKRSATKFDKDLKLSSIEYMILWFSVLFALIRKNLMQDLRDTLQVSFQYISPISQVLLFALCIGRNPLGIEIGIISNDFSFLNFSHKYLEVINEEYIHLNYYKNYSQAIEDVRNLKLWAVMSFNHYYSHAFLDRAAYNVSNASIKNSTILLNVDLSNKIVTDLTYKLLSKYYNKFVTQEFKKYDVDSKYALSYIEYPEIIYGNNKNEKYTGYMNFMLPGIIINLTFAMAIAITSITLINERNGQTMERNYASGITSTQMIIAHATGRIMLSGPYALLVILIPIILFKVPLIGNLFSAALITLSQNIAGMACGILVAATSESVLMSMVTTSGTFMICLFTSGTLWPIEAIPLKIRWLAYLQPTTLATEALRSIMLRGWPLSHFEIWISFAFTFLWIIFLFLISIKTFKMSH